jgi:putative sterol carrier protein
MKVRVPAQALPGGVDGWMRAIGEESRRRHGFAGLHGWLRLEVDGNLVAMLRVFDGGARVMRNGEGAPADARVDFADPATLVEVLVGDLNPVAAVLQGRLQVNGSFAFATKTLLGLKAGRQSIGPGVT